MAKERGARDGSYLISIGSALGGALCLFLTGVILHTFGASIGTTAEGKALLSWGAVGVHILGFVLMGLAFGYFCNARTRNLGWAIPCLLVMLSAGGFTFWNLYGFASAERMSATKTVEEAKARMAAQAAERAALAKERQKAQERLAQSQLRFMQSEVEDARGKVRKQLSKDFAKNSAQIIAEIGKESATLPSAPAIEGSLSPDEGAAQLAALAGVETRTVQTVYAMWMAKLLVALEMLLWPMASFTWPRRGAVVAQIVEPAEQAATVAVHGLQPLTEPPEKAPLLIEHQPAPAAAKQAAKKPGPRRAHLPEATASLEAIEFPLRDLTGPERKADRIDTSAERFLVWLQACGLCQQPTPTEEVDKLYLEFCAADHREPAAWHLVKGALRKLKPVYDGKLTQPDGVRAVRWIIKPGKYPKPAPLPAREEKPAAHPKQEGASVVELRPLAGAPANDDEPAPLPAQLPSKPAFTSRERFEHPVVNAARAHWMRRDARNHNRKQRGSRSGRRAA